MAKCNDCICSEVCYYKSFNDVRRLEKRRNDVEKICKSFVHRDILKNAPTVDAVEVVHGHKIVRERHRGVARYIPCPCCGSAVPGNKPYTEKIEYCSVCSKKLDDTFQNYCPNCGAKMDGDKNGN